MAPTRSNAASSPRPFWDSDHGFRAEQRAADAARQCRASIFDGSKIKLSINNLFDDHSIVAISAANDGTTLTSTTVNNALKVTQNQQLYSPSWADSLETQSGREIMISFQIGLTRRER